MKVQMVSLISQVLFSVRYHHHVYSGMEGALMPERIGANSLTSFCKRMSLFIRTGGVAVQAINKKVHIKGDFFLCCSIS